MLGNLGFISSNSATTISACHWHDVISIHIQNCEYSPKRDWHNEVFAESNVRSNKLSLIYEFIYTARLHAVLQISLAYRKPLAVTFRYFSFIKCCYKRHLFVQNWLFLYNNQLFPTPVIKSLRKRVIKTPVKTNTV